MVKSAAESSAAVAKDREVPTPAAAPSAEGGKVKAVAGDDGSYRLGPRDMVRIEVWNRAEVEYDWRPVTVTEKGTVFLPLLNDVDVSGLTVSEAMTKLQRLYDAFIKDPQVFMQIQEYNSRQVNVIGEVKLPGRYALKGEVRLSALLAEAGDLTKYASKVVRLVRDHGPDEPAEVREIDLNKLNAGEAKENILILPNDSIYVMTNKNIVYVTGMVKAEGFVDWEEGMTAQQAIILGGGFADGAAGGRTKLFRKVDGKTVQRKIDADDQKNPVLLEPGDILDVPKSFF